MLPTEADLFDLLKFPARGLRGVMVRSSNQAWVDGSGSSRGLSGPADLEWLVATRSVSDAVLVSAKTAIAENYRPIKHRPVYASARKANKLSERVKLVCATNDVNRAEDIQEVADWVITQNPEVHDKMPDKSIYFQGNWSMGLRKLNELGLHRISCEGGPALLNSLVAANQLDQLALTHSPFPGVANGLFPNLEAWINRNQNIWESNSGGFNFELRGKLPTWKDLLPNHNFKILREAYTEPAFSVDYEKSPAEGYYACLACGNRLFDASTQFNAQCGWPAFWDAYSNDSTKLIDDFSYGMKRTEVVCAACESHLGHVFYGEGFGFPTDARYCINAGAIERRHWDLPTGNGTNSAER